ncbi:MAG TPA: M67 family metallopeptidase [Pyrinomonadaceae bacterium]|jgi:proteasome lid subunit RPN8/RPN11
MRREHAAAIRAHAEREYPHECCGLLVGRITPDGRTRVIEELYPVANEFDRATLHEVFDGATTERNDAAAQSVAEAAAEVDADATAADVASERHRRMLIPPQAYLRAERRYAAQGWGVVGNYHSHPEHPAVPSRFDLEHLAPWPTMSYVVVSVRAGQAAELRSWELAADRSRFDEEQWAEIETT